MRKTLWIMIVCGICAAFLLGVCTVSAQTEVFRYYEKKDYEPHMALYGGEDGLDFYRILTKEGAKHLRAAEPGKKGGYLIVEIGFDQGKSVPELFQAAGFSDVTVKKDYAGHDRVVMGHL